MTVGLGAAEEHLGVKIEYDAEKGELALSQPAYTQELLTEFKMENSKPVPTPASAVRLTADMCPKTDEEKAEMAEWRTKLHSGVMKLRFLAQNTRYEILYAVGELSRWLVNPGQEHVKAFKRVLRYLKGTHDYKLIYRRTNRRGDNDDYIIDDECVGYADASWAECPDTGLSTTGYVFMMCGAAICAKTLRQRIIATSTAEAELLALNTAGKQGVWLRLLREQLGMDNSKPMILMEDNEAAKRIAETGRRSKRTKHFRVREFWINNKVVDKTFIIKHCPTTEMLADLMMKPLSKVVFERLRTKIGIVRVPV